ncbi:fungal-specific transcription factor domain-containing protein [Xylogone sp. PMI_703]|nr:fungal-specific transcription factor domain-containing protein [Xylogone sp. PMI_703]
MSERVRSTTGCWTCKLRKKKCDETKPDCSICSSLGLSCDGYGCRPDWMDGGIKEKRMGAKVRDAVREATSQKKRVAMQKRQLQLKSLQEDLNRFNSAVSLPSPTESHLLPYANWNPSPGTPENHHIPNLIDGPPPNLNPEQSLSYLKQNEATLLMHYLDTVFPLQFRFYDPSIEERGRGWLLYLLLQTKPLYHAACSLAAYHRQTMYCLGNGMQEACFTIEALNQQYSIAIVELRRYMAELLSPNRQRTLAENVQLLCSISLFVSIEAYTSATETWKMHLEAATALIPDIRKQIYQDRPADVLLPTFQIAKHFFASVVYWYNIVSCTLSPSISKPFSFCGDDTQGEADVIPFDKVIGCEDWVVFAIRDIVELEYQKSTMRAAGELNLQELIRFGNDIEGRLRRGVEKLKSSIMEQQSRTLTSEWDASLIRHNTDYIRGCVTNVYCNAALVYLHTVMSGAYPHLPSIRDNVTRTIEAVQALPDPHLIHGMLWPFCVAGCMATEQDQETFEKFTRFCNPVHAVFGIVKATVIIEECWRLRKLDPGSGAVDWRTAMKSLKLHVLLV